MSTGYIRVAAMLLLLVVGAGCAALRQQSAPKATPPGPPASRGVEPAPGVTCNGTTSRSRCGGKIRNLMVNMVNGYSVDARIARSDTSVTEWMHICQVSVTEGCRGVLSILASAKALGQDVVVEQAVVLVKHGGQEPIPISPPNDSWCADLDRGLLDSGTTVTLGEYCTASLY